MAAAPDKDGPAPSEGARGAVAPSDDRLARSVERVLEEQRRFESHRATRLGRGMEAATGPVADMARRALPEGALRQALRFADKGAGWTLPKGLRDHDADDIEACEAAALRVQRWAVAGNAASGFGAGWFGGPGLTVDIPATIGMAARNVRATGLAYGFGTDDDDELLFRLAVLELSTTSGLEARGAALGKVNRMAAVLSGKAALEKSADWVVDKVVERVSRQLGVSFLQRKAGQIVPIVGGLAGAAINASFQTDVSRAARYGYRQRWLMHRKVIPGPEEGGA